MLLQAVKGVRVRARGIIQIKQHRRTLRRGFQQIAEFPEHVRADRVPFVRDHVPAVQILIDENIEVIEPEIRKLLGELPFAVHRANHLHFHQVVDDFVLVLERQGIHPLRLPGDFSQALLIFIDRQAQALGGDIGLRILIQQACRVERKRGILGEAGVDHRIAQVFRMKLRLDPIFEASFFDLLHLARTGAESEPVKCVQNGFLLVQFMDGKFAREICA